MNAVKELRQLTGLCLLETKNYIESIDISSIPTSKELCDTISSSHNSQEVKCHKCKSTQITTKTKGFGFGKAVAGGLLLVPVGLLGGVMVVKK